MLNVQIDHPDGTSDSIPASRLEGDYVMDEMDIGIAHIDRASATSTPFYEDEDEITITYRGDREFYGILRDVVSNDGQVKLVVDSPERFAKDAKRSEGDLVYDPETDRKIVRDAISDIPQLTERNVELVDSQNTFIFSHASPAKRIREVSKQTGAEVMYHPDGTVEYAERIGRDRTVSATGIVLSPGSGNISESFDPERISGDEHATHLTMLGSGEGQAQRMAMIVPDSDPDYTEGDSVFTYSDSTDPSDWGDTKRRAWTTKVNKEVNDTSMLGKNGLILIEELRSNFTEVETTVENHEVQLGDLWTVQNPAEDVDEDLRAMEVTEIIDTDGKRFEVKFSNRRLTRQNKDKDIQGDLDNYNMAFEGSNVTETAGPFEDPIDEANAMDWVFNYYYPDEVVYEHRVKLHLWGRAYRAKTRGSAAGGQHTHDVEIPFSQLSHDHSVEIPFSNLSHSHPVEIPFSNLDHDHPVDIPFSEVNHGHPVPLSVTAPSNAGDSDNADPIGYSPILNSGDTFDFEFNLPTVDGNGRSAYVYAYVQCLDDNGGFAQASLRVENITQWRTLYDSGDWTFETNNLQFIQAMDTATSSGEDLSGDRIKVTLFMTDQSSSDVSMSVHAGAMLLGDHTHDLNDTLTADTEFFNDQSKTAETEFFNDVVKSAETEFFDDYTSTADAEFFDDTIESAEPDGSHTHEPIPGVVRSFDGEIKYPGTVEVSVNGTTVATGVGASGEPWQEEVDLQGVLNPGMRNEFRVSPEEADAIGEIVGQVDVDAYRQILGRG